MKALVLIAVMSLAGCASLNQTYADLDLNNPNSKASLEIKENALKDLAAENSWKADWCAKAGLNQDCLK